MSSKKIGARNIRAKLHEKLVIKTSPEDMSAVHELVRFAEVIFLYHRLHYNAVPELFLDLAQITLVDHTTFREANFGWPSENGVLISSSSVDDAIFRT